MRVIFGILAQYKTTFVALFSVASPLFFMQIKQEGQGLSWPFLLLFAASMAVLVAASLAPGRYARLERLETVLSTIHKVLELKDDERITVHHIKSRRRQKYEQLVDYFPRKHGGRGRVYNFTHGIVGRCIMNMGTHFYSMPEGMEFKEAMNKEWQFGPEELDRLTRRKSYFALAIVNSRNRAKAVLFMDSPDRERFTSENAKVVERKVRSLFLPILEEILRD